MMETDNTMETREFSETAGNRLCTNCSNVMVPADSVHENGFSFTWYECRAPNCGEQWLDKKAIPKKGA